MKTKFWSFRLYVACVFLASNVLIQSQGRHYILLSDSYLLDDCPICERPSIMLPLRGSFEFESLGNFNAFRVSNIHFTTPGYSVEGEGIITIILETASQEASFNLHVKKGDEPAEILVFTNEVKNITHGFPMLDLTVKEKPGTLIRVYSVRMEAAPLKGLWFSTTESFVDHSIPEGSIKRSGGDILSMDGSVVKSWESLVQNFNLLPPDINVGIDVFATNRAGQFLVSLVEDTESTSGTLLHGDLLNTNGSPAVDHSSLESGFDFSPPGDPGLDAYFPLAEGPTLFSVSSNLHSTALDQDISSGDLLSSAGSVYKSGREIISKFMPIYLEQNYGLDALFVWPSGEIWFSTESDFYSQVVGQIYSGDILSDAGYVVFRNRELLQPFRPEDERVNYGLDGMMVFPDTSDSVDVKVPVMTITKEGVTVTIRWEGKSTEFRLEKAATVQGPYLPELDWSSATSWTGNINGASEYFRVLAK